MSGRRSRAPLALAAAVLCLAAALGGCGVGPGDAPDSPVALTITRDFGATRVLHSADAKVSGADTVMRVTQRNADVTTRFGGDFVQSIAGIAGGRRDGRPVDWFIYVNGILTNQGAGALRARGGDRIWWDHHDWGLTPDVPAVVGAFPQPFLHGSDGTRRPVRVECAEPRSRPCAAVADRLVQLGVPATRDALERSSADESLRVLVGPWQRLRGRAAEADDLDRGPRSSGVFARFDEAGTRLRVLDPRGRVARTLGAATGLVAAVRELDGQPVWFVTGTDAAGVAAAARALDESVLRDRFAVAVSRGLPVSVPLTRAGR
ncbi:MAG: DUF4430 domain-containing protein [Solirubrobacteraceae bacterium]|nr:DUF4430 domain-containing protein [Solirubrobacteraceae bacterium]